MDIYSEAIRQVMNGRRFRVDFRRRKLVVGGRVIINDGKYQGDLGVELLDVAEFQQRLLGLYENYKYSVPSARSENGKRKYFHALRLDELPEEDMLYGMPREEARARLEVWLLCCILNGSFHVPDGKWFWKSPEDGDLVLLAVWGKAIEKDNKNNTKQQE